MNRVVPRLQREGWRLEEPQANVNRWTAPSGQTVHTFTTRTEPRFTFAYNPYDDDMARMRKRLILEPMLTHAWHEATWRCCNRTRGLVIDVGGNFGWYTLYSLALGCEHCERCAAVARRRHHGSRRGLSSWWHVLLRERHAHFGLRVSTLSHHDLRERVVRLGIVRRVFSGAQKVRLRLCQVTCLKGRASKLVLMVGIFSRGWVLLDSC